MTVYVVQMPVRRDPATGQMVPSVDLTPAQEYGEVATLLASGPVALLPAQMLATLRHGLRNFTDDDYLLPTGDPTAIAAAAIVASQANMGRVRILKWDGRTRRYMAVPLFVDRRFQDELE